MHRSWEIFGQELGHLIRVLFFLLQNLFHQFSRRWIKGRHELDDLAVGLDGDSLGDQVLADHVFEILSFDVFGVALGGKAFGVEIRLSTQLYDPFGDAMGVLELLLRVLQEFLLDSFNQNPFSRSDTELTVYFRKPGQPQRFHLVSLPRNLRYFHLFRVPRICR